LEVGEFPKNTFRFEIHYRVSQASLRLLLLQFISGNIHSFKSAKKRNAWGRVQVKFQMQTSLVLFL
jgi:hypothetical protein